MPFTTALVVDSLQRLACVAVIIQDFARPDRNAAYPMRCCELEFVEAVRHGAGVVLIELDLDTFEGKLRTDTSI